MCGILGGNCKEWDYKKGILSMRHRGPDGQRIVQFSQFTLGFARLAILDLTDKGKRWVLQYLINIMRKII